MFLSPRFLLTSAALSLVSNMALAHYDCCDDDDDVERSYEYLLEGDFQLSLLLGIATTSQENSTIQIDITEQDTLVQDSSDWDSWTGQFGVSYVMPLYWSWDDDADDDDIRWFDSLTPQLNVYILGGSTLEGDVLRFGDEDDNSATYSMDFNSTRLMFDLALDVLTVRDFSFYGLGGIGIAWNSTDFHWKGNQGTVVEGKEFNLDETDSSGLAYEFGGGVNYAVGENIDIALQYLYTVFDDVNVSGVNELNGFEAESSSMDIKSQSVLLGVRLTI